MKRVLFFVILVLSFFFSSVAYADKWFTDLIDESQPKAYICDDGDCWLQAGVELAKDGINDVEKDRTFSEYIQDVIVYLLTFVSIVAVVYIIYAGFNILIGNGDEEKLKKSKMTIIYVVIGIVIIWLAWSMTAFILDLLYNNT